MPKTNLIQIHGAPGVGKSTLAMEVHTKLSKAGFTSQYVTEWIKTYADRRWAMGPADQIGVLGGQAMSINHALEGKYDFVVTCSSPILCAFYSNYYSDNAFPGLVQVVKEWNAFQRKAYDLEVKEYFLVLPEVDYLMRYKQEGRYENFATALKMQEAMLEWYDYNFEDFENIGFIELDDIWGDLFPSEGK